MSDHEGHGHDDWEAVSLPGGPASSYGARESFNHRIVPNHLARREGLPPSNRAVDLHNQPPLRRQNQVPSSYRPLIQGVQGDHRSHAGGPQRAPIPTKAVVRQETEGMRLSRSGAPAAAAYELMNTFEVILQKVVRPDMSERRVARNSLDDICQKTGTWIPTPFDDSNKLQIWGDAEDVAQAKTFLKLWEHEISVYGLKPKGKAWAKSNALNFMEEGRAERRTENQQLIDSINSIPDLSFSFEAFLIWPRFLDLGDFQQQYAEVLKAMGKKYVCRIEPQDDDYPRIRVCAVSEKELLEIYHRLINLVKEHVTLRRSRLRANFVCMPSVKMYRDRVGLDKDPQTNSFLPTLHGESLKEEEENDWNTLRRTEQVETRRKTRKLIETCIRSLYIYGKHVRMRVTFGELGFYRYARPADGEESHSFDDFYQMAGNQRTEIVQHPLRSTEGDIYSLVDVLASMELLGKPVETYMVQYDFDAPMHTTLRLEAEYKKGVFDDSESCGQRWLQYKSHEVNEKLDINVLDFEKPNYSVHVGVVDIFDDVRNRKALQQFQSNIRFTIPKKGIQAKAQRRAIFPPGHAELRRVAEISLARFRFKGTHGILEVRRKDTYDEGVGRSSTTPVTTAWAAQYYYEDWDTYLGAFANLQPGQDVSWERDFATFFPESMSEFDARALPRGWQAFNAEVEQIQDLLAEAIANLPKVNRNGVSIANTNGDTADLLLPSINGVH